MMKSDNTMESNESTEVVNKNIYFILFFFLNMSIIFLINRIEIGETAN